MACGRGKKTGSTMKDKAKGKAPKAGNRKRK